MVGPSVVLEVDSGGDELVHPLVQIVVVPARVVLHLLAGVVEVDRSGVLAGGQLTGEDVRLGAERLRAAPDPLQPSQPTSASSSAPSPTERKNCLKSAENVGENVAETHHWLWSLPALLVRRPTSW